MSFPSLSLTRRWAAAALALAVLVAPACGDGKEKQGAVELGEIPASHVPAELLGMRLEPEKSADLIRETDKQPFIEEIGLFSMRRDELLQATLQVARFRPEAKLDERRFRDNIARQVSTGEPQVLRMGQDLVYMSAGQRQSVVVWFKERTMFVLAMREEFPRPRALLRAALGVQP